MRFCHACLTFAAAIGAVLLGALPAGAQAVGEAPDTPVTGWGYIALTLFLALCVCLASFIGSKRGHQD